MSVEDRLRQGLVRNASAYEPDVEAALREVAMRRRPRRLLFSSVVWVPVAAACVVAVVVVASFALRVSRHRSEPTPVAPSASVSQPLSGTLRTSVPDTPGVVRARHLTGRWVLRLAPDGTMRVTGPAAYDGVLSAAFFDSHASRFRTSLFGQDLCSGLPLGQYTWHRNGHVVHFTVSDDPCAGRVAVLTAAAWQMP